MKRTKWAITDLETRETIEYGYEYEHCGYKAKVTKIKSGWSLEVEGKYHGPYRTLNDRIDGAKAAFDRYVDNKLREKYNMELLPVK